MELRTPLIIIGAFATISLGVGAEDYVGGLKPPKSSPPEPKAPPAVISFVSESVPSFALSRADGNPDAGYRLKLGYQYSRYFAVEGQYVDFGRTAGEVFSGSSNLASAFRSTGM